MRPAPPEQPPSNADSSPDGGAAEASTGAPHGGSQPRSPGWWAGRIGAAVIALLGIATGALFLFRAGGPPAGPSHPPPPTSPAPSPRTAFSFPLTATSSVPTGKRNAGAVRDAAAKVQSTLSAFYDTAFMDPTTRRDGLPASAWNAFARPVQDRARSDASSLTLGESGATIDKLSVTDATLSVRVLLDPQGRPQAAVANVMFAATGTLSGGAAVLVSNRASFLLRPAGETWVVVGYPTASTDVQSPAPSPSASVTATPTAGGSPSSGASP